MIDSQV